MARKCLTPARGGKYVNGKIHDSLSIKIFSFLSFTSNIQREKKKLIFLFHSIFQHVLVLQIAFLTSIE